MDPSGELSDQDRSHPLEAELLMDAQELDRCHPLLPARQRVYFERIAQDSSMQLIRLYTNTHPRS